MTNSTLLVPSTLSPDEASTDNTITFVIGFSILVLFVLAGIVASVFLCFTLKKDSYLWEAVFEGAAKDQQPDGASPSTSSSHKPNTSNEMSCTPLEGVSIDCHKHSDVVL